MTFNCFRCGQCCKEFYPEVTREELQRIKEYLSEERWKGFQEHLVDSSPYQKEKAFPDNQFIKPPCPFLTEKNRCSIHSVCKPNSCQHWICGRKSADEPFNFSAHAANFWVEGIKLLMKDGSIVDLDPTLFCHAETQTLGTSTYHLLKKDVPADGPATEYIASAATVARILFANTYDSRFILQLTNVEKILATTWTVYYRAYASGGTVHCDVTIIIRQNDDTVRTTIATNVANSPDLGTSYSTVSGTYSFSEYTVVDDTDWLEVDIYADVTAAQGGKKAYLNFDDSGLAEADQTRVTNVSFQLAVILRQVTENLSVISTVPARIYSGTRRISLNLEVISAIFSSLKKAAPFVRQFIETLIVSARLVRSYSGVRLFTQNLSILKAIFQRRVAYIRRLVQNLSILTDRFSRIVSFIKRLTVNLSVISSLFSRAVSYIRIQTENLSSIRDVFSSTLTKAPIVRQLIENLSSIGDKFSRRVSNIRALRLNLSLLQDILMRYINYVRTFPQTTIIRTIFRRVHGFPRVLVQNLSALRNVFMRKVSYERTFPQQIVVRAVLTTVKDILRSFVQNLSVIQAIFTRRIQYLRRFSQFTYIQDAFTFVYTAYIKIYQLVQNLSVIAAKFTSTYTPLIPVYQFIENLSTISVKLIRKVAYRRTIREDLAAIQDKFKRSVGRVRKWIEDLVVPTP